MCQINENFICSCFVQPGSGPTVQVKCIPGKDLTPDKHTKNVPGPLFAHYIKELVNESCGAA